MDANAFMFALVEELEVCWREFPADMQILLVYEAIEYGWLHSGFAEAQTNGDGAAPEHAQSASVSLWEGW
jgi:hypothetical protein